MDVAPVSAQNLNVWGPIVARMGFPGQTHMFEGQKRQAGNDEKVMRGRKEDVKTRNREASWALLKAVPQISRKKRGKTPSFSVCLDPVAGT